MRRGSRSQLTQRHEMRILIAVVTCHKFRSRADAQRNTWVKDMHGAALRFFYGGGEAEGADEVILPVGDDYRSSRSICRAGLRYFVISSATSPNGHNAPCWTVSVPPAWSPELSWITCRNAKSVPAS